MNDHQVIRSQKFYHQHNQLITAIAINHKLGIVATGQLNQNHTTTMISIWSINTMRTIKNIPFHQESIIALSFSPDGNLLCSIGNDIQHTLAIWLWKDQRLIASSTISIYNITGLIFNHSFYLTSKNYQFITVANKDLKFWSLNSSVLTYSVANTIIDSIKHDNIYTCADYLYNYHDDHLDQTTISSHINTSATISIIGTTTGHIYIFKNEYLLKYKAAHIGHVTAIHVYKHGFITAGQDGKLVLWNNNVHKSYLLILIIH